MAKLTIVIKPCEEGGYSAYIKEIRGAISEGSTEREALDNVLDAMKELLAAQAEGQLLASATRVLPHEVELALA
jgi:predicted RNase H-like HicB family nuclease